MSDKQYYLDDVLDEKNLHAIYTGIGRSREDKITLYESIGILAKDYPDIAKGLAEIYVWKLVGEEWKK